MSTITDTQKIEELLTRGVEALAHKETLKEMLSRGEPLRVKLGIDPTSPHIHLGRATQLLKLRDFQELGHQIVFIVGDATGVIGDTSDKEAERPMLSRETVAENEKKYFEQAAMVIDIEKAEKHHNSAWLDTLTYAEIGKQADAFSVADFIARDNIAKRLKEGKRISLRETLYPLMQGYDSVAVKADVEIGGTDQWFNLLAGRTLQELYGQKPQQIMVNKLIRGLDGRKMSSSWGNIIAIESGADDMYGKIMSLHDDLLEEYFVSCTRVPMEEVASTLKAGDPKAAKMRLAREIVALFRGHEAAEQAEHSFIETFSGKGMPSDAPDVIVSSNDTLGDILLKNNIVASNNELRRLLSEGAVENITTGEKLNDIKTTFSEDVQIKVGKRRFISIHLS